MCLSNIKFQFLSWNNKITIEAKDPSKQGLIGQRKGFSEQDIRHANRYLRCGDHHEDIVGNAVE